MITLPSYRATRCSCKTEPPYPTLIQRALTGVPIPQLHTPPSRTHHRDRAESLKAQWGVWMAVGDFDDYDDAKKLAHTIGRAGGSAYTPPGAFEAEVHPVTVAVTDEFGTTPEIVYRVHARYIGK